MRKLGFIIIILCLFAAYILHKQQSIHDQETARQTTTFFINALSQGDIKSASHYVLSDVQLFQDLQKNENFLSFSDSNIIEIIKVNDDSSKNRPQNYQKFYKIMSVMLKIKIEHKNDAAWPVGDHILFICLVKQSPQSNWLIAELGSGP